MMASFFGLASAEEGPASSVAVATAATLMGTVFVIIILYYLFNWKDPDIRRYSYETVSATVSIFCAVLLFQSFQNTLYHCVLRHLPDLVQIICNFLHRWWWLAVLQVTL